MLLETDCEMPRVVDVELDDYYVNCEATAKAMVAVNMFVECVVHERIDVVREALDYLVDMIDYYYSV